jgi:CBS-domain-containing membrane protein
MFADTSLIHRRDPLGGDRLDTAVRDIMCPGVIVLGDDASVLQAQRALLAHQVHAVLVLERTRSRPLGWVTSRGLLAWCDRDTILAQARAAVSEPAVVIGPSATAREALDLLDSTGATRLLVAHRADWLPEGVVADVDLLRLVAR